MAEVTLKDCVKTKLDSLHLRSALREAGCDDKTDELVNVGLHDLPSGATWAQAHLLAVGKDGRESLVNGLRVLFVGEEGTVVLQIGQDLRRVSIDAVQV